MGILITGRHVEVPEALRAYINEKAQKLSRYYDRIHDIEVVLDQDSDQLTAEMIVRVERKHTYIASDSGPDALALIDGITEKLGRQLVKHKEKNRTKKGGASADGGGSMS